MYRAATTMLCLKFVHRSYYDPKAAVILYIILPTQFFLCAMNTFI